MQNEKLKQVGEFWSARTRNPTAPRNGFWMFPEILRHMNWMICGERVGGSGNGVALKVLRDFGVPFEYGVSVGCGGADKELHLLRKNVVKRFDLYDISEARAELARKNAARFGLSGRATVYCADAFDHVTKDYDLVHWSGSLHHMFDVDAAVRWSRDTLSTGGLLVVDEYVGPNRVQLTERVEEICNEVRARMPERFFVNPGKPNRPFPREVPLIDPEELARRDPSECVDSARILPSVEQHFPDAEVIHTGGVVYFLALRQILRNFSDQDSELLEMLLCLDGVLARFGVSVRAAAFGVKS